MKPAMFFGFGTVSFTPDAAGRTEVRTDQQGDTCTFNYEFAGRRTGKTYVGNAASSLAGQSERERTGTQHV